MVEVYLRQAMFGLLRKKKKTKARRAPTKRRQRLSPDARKRLAYFKSLGFKPKDLVIIEKPKPREEIAIVGNVQLVRRYVREDMDLAHPEVEDEMEIAEYEE